VNTDSNRYDGRLENVFQGNYIFQHIHRHTYHRNITVGRYVVGIVDCARYEHTTVAYQLDFIHTIVLFNMTHNPIVVVYHRGCNDVWQMIRTPTRKTDNIDHTNTDVRKKVAFVLVLTIYSFSSGIFKEIRVHNVQISGAERLSCI
jgi:hypothetical protein